jgi:hypothetical protein
VLHIVGCPAPVSPFLGDIDIEQFDVFAEKLMSDALLPFAKTNFHMMRSRRRRSLYQELHAVAPSSRRIILFSKAEMKAAHGPIEKHLGELPGRTRILSEDLKLFVAQVCDTTGVPFEGTQLLRRSTKREVLEWIGENRSTLGEAFTTIAANQRRVGH